MLQMSVIFIVLYAFKPITVEGHFHKNLFPDVHTSEFVKMIGTDFSLDGKIWKTAGFNTYLLIEQAAELPRGTFNADFSNGKGKEEILTQL